MAKTEGKIYMDPEIGEVVFRKSARSRSIGIRVHPVKGVSVSVPTILPYSAAMAFFRLRRQWILDALARQKERAKDVTRLSSEEIESLRLQAKAELPPRLAELAARYGFRYNKVTIKNNVSNWGSCSAKGNINLNLNIVRLPKVLQDYVLLHELCHLKHQDHGHAFHLLLEHVCTDNILKLMDQGDEMAAALASKASVSKAKYPLDHILTKEIKSFHMNLLNR